MGDGKDGGDVGMFTLGDLIGDSCNGTEKGTNFCFFLGSFLGSNFGGPAGGGRVFATIGLLGGKEVAGWGAW